MSNGTRFDPPSAVVDPALSELLLRLRTTYGAGGMQSRMEAAERQVFEYGVAARQKVIEGACAMVFAQWAAHRFIVRHSKVRLLRAAYFTGCVLTTSAFVRSRARQASGEMFARVVTLPTTSALGNEARVILAELEGPDGPHFRAVCEEKGFILNFDVLNTSFGGTVHPQLSLQPRLKDAQGREKSKLRKPFPAPQRRGITNDAEELPPRTVVRGVGSRKSSDKEMSAQVQPDKWSVDDNAAAIDWAEPTQNEVSWANGKPFDFASAVRGITVDDDNEEGEELTPSQQRAAERRERRRVARERSQSRGSSW